MRLTSAFAFISLSVGVASTLSIPHATRSDDTSASLSIASRDAPLSRRLCGDDELVERSLYDDELIERSWLDEDQLIERLFDDYDYGLEARKSANRKAKAAAAAAKGPAGTKAGRTAAYQAANLGKNAAKKKDRNDQFKANWQAKNPDAKFKKNQNGKAPAKNWGRKGVQPGQTVHWDPNAVKQLDNLGLHGKERKSVKKFHVNTAKKAMKENGATGAKIYQLAHKNTSPLDKNMHVTGKLFKGKDGNIPIPPKFKPAGGGDAKYHHMYTPSNDPNKLPTALKNAVTKQGKTLDQI